MFPYLESFSLLLLAAVVFVIFIFRILLLVLIGAFSLFAVALLNLCVLALGRCGANMARLC